MALILAINPGNSHSPTLARLARELKGFELIGAESCAIAITAINERVPDIVLLPHRSARGEAELLARLRAVPGGVPTLQLPPVASADPAALAKNIRTLLTAKANAPAPAPKRIVASPHLIAASKAAIAWIHARRAQWAEIDARELASEPVFAPAAGRHEPANLRTHEPHEAHEPHEPYGPGESDEPERRSLLSRAFAWLPRVAILALVAVLTVASVWLWPQISGTATDAVAPLSSTSEPAPVETSVPAAPSEPPPPSTPVAAEPDPAEKTSGWIAVSAPFDISVTNANETILLDDRGRAMLAPGTYRLRFQNNAIGYDEARSIEVRATATTTVNLLPQTTIRVRSNVPAEVLIDGTSAGETPFNGRMAFGPHTVTVRTARGQRQITVAPTVKPVQLEVDFSKP